MARNSNFGKNLRALREDRKMTQARLAAALDITTATVSHWENRGTSPNSKEAIEQLCSVFDVTENDLFGYSDGYYAKTRLGGLSEKIKPVAASGSLPIIGAAHAGEPCPAFELDCGSIPCPEEYCKEGNFFIKITGDSMNNVLTDGSYALIDTHVDAQSGDIALVKVNGDDAAVKRIKKMDGFIVLEPDSTNPSHKRRIIDATDQSSPEVRILGKVVYAVNRL